MKVLKWMGIIAGVIVMAGAGAYFFAQSNLRDLDDVERRKAPGKFAELSDGKVHYQWFGPGDGDVVVLVHGFSTPSFVWRGQIGPQNEAGLRVLSYDNYGRGWSDRPDLDNDADLFDRQLVELLKSQGVTEPFNLLGYSMGGAISINYVSRHPGSAKRLALIAPAGFPDPENAASKLLAMVNFPVIGEWIMAVVGNKLMIKGLMKPENQSNVIPDLVERYIEQASYRGYLRSLISTIRHFPLTTAQPAFEKVGKQALPVAVIWGDLDSIVPYANAAMVKRAIPRLDLTTIKGGHHSITYTQVDKVAASLVPFFTAPAE